MIKSLKFVCLLVVLDTLVAKVEHNYYWRDYRGTIPDDCYNVAENLYVAQVVSYWLMPGTFDARTKEAYTEQGDKVTIKDNIKLLCDLHSDNFYWKKINVHDLVGPELEDLVIGGSELNNNLYIGKIFNDGEWKIGKVFPPTHEFKGLRVWDQKGTRYVTETFEVLKYRLRHKYKHVFNCAPDYYWREYNGQIPLDAVPGSTGGYIAQIVVEGGGLVPGAIYADYNKAIAVVNDKRHETSNHVKILCSKHVGDFLWQQVSIGVPINSTRLVEGGVEGGKVLYIGRTYHQDKCKIGKASATSHTLKIWKDDGGAETVSNFEVLEYESENKDGEVTKLIALEDDSQQNDMRTRML